MEQGEEAPYEFVPYKRGAFSFTSYADRRKLIDRGLIEDEDDSWTITPDGRRAAGEPDPSLPEFLQRFDGLRGDALIAETYRRFPETAIRSEIAKRVLEKDAEALRRIEDAQPRPAVRRLFTIGYEGRSLESYLNTLLRAGVTVLCDVRRNPLSRKYGFSKKTLARACEGVGIRYEHMPEIGIASEERRELRTQADYDALFDRYERTWLPLQDPALERISEWIREGAGLALTCFEADSDRCHRHCVAEAVERRLDLRGTHL
jgi:hypothetical protein